MAYFEVWLPHSHSTFAVKIKETLRSETGRIERVGFELLAKKISCILDISIIILIIANDISSDLSLYVCVLKRDIINTAVSRVISTVGPLRTHRLLGLTLWETTSGLWLIKSRWTAGLCA